MFNNLIKILILSLLIFISIFSYSQNIKISGVIKERVDKFDKKGNIKENDFEIIDVSKVKISISNSKDKNVCSVTTNNDGDYSIKFDAKKEVYFLNIEKDGYLPKKSELDLTNFIEGEILILNEWDFGIRKNNDNVTSSILKKAFERYYYQPKTRELVYDDEYALDYQIKFADAIFTQIEAIHQEQPTEDTEKALVKAKEIIEESKDKAIAILNEAIIEKNRIIALNKEKESNFSDLEINQIKQKEKLRYDKIIKDFKNEERAKLYTIIRDSILNVANILNEDNEINNNRAIKEDEIGSKKLALYAKKQQLEIDRLKALTTEDSLIIQLREEEIASAEAEIKSSENEILATKSQLKAEHNELLFRKEENKNQKNIIYIISLLIALALAVSLFIYRNLREKKKSELKLKTQNLIIEEKSNSILSSIKYAKRIQDAILPATEFWKENLSNSFILYMPKDIVSGDFYWMQNLSKNEVLFAAVDCTGHGVPGGFMSIIGYHSLHRSINEFGLKKPSEILDSMQTSVNAVLRQGFGKHSIKDGMDIALCHYNKKTKELQYSGAYNPLWIIRENEILEYTATKQAVGSFTEDYSAFENHTIQLQDGDTFYIFSDGFADQFGGPRGKKIMSKGLKNILLEMKNLAIEKQKIELKKYLYDWMNEGEEDQVDDVCIIGVKV